MHSTYEKLQKWRKIRTPLWLFLVFTNKRISADKDDNHELLDSDNFAGNQYHSICISIYFTSDENFQVMILVHALCHILDIHRKKRETRFTY